MKKKPGELGAHRVDQGMRGEGLCKSQAGDAEKRSRYFDFYDLAPVGYCILSERGLILEANLTAATLLGVTRGALPRQPLSRFILDADRDIFNLHSGKLFETGEPQECKLRLVKPDGTIFWSHLKGSTAKAEDGAPVCCVALLDITGSKQAEEAMHSAEANFRLFFDSITDIVCVATPEGRVLFANRAAQIKMGYSGDELEGMHILDWHQPEDRADAAMIIATVLSGEQVICPLPLVARDGTAIPVETHIWCGEWGGQDCIFGICKDLSAEHEAQMRFERIFRSNPSPMAISSIPGRRFTDVNDAFVEVTGYTREEIIGKSSTELGLIADPGAQNALVEILSTGSPIANHEIQVRRKDGMLRDGLFSGEIIRSQGREYFLTVMIDITDRKRSEAERERLSAAIEQASEAVVITDAGGTIQYANPAFTRITGYTREEACGRNPRILKSGKHDTEFYRALWETLAAGQVWHGQFVNKRQDGTLYNEDATISPVRDSSGTIGNYVAVKRDITSELGLQAQLTQARKMDAVGRLAGGVAHDFNNMLSVILGHADNALQIAASTEPLHADLVEIQKAAQRSADLTRQLLAFARKQTAAPRVLDLNESIGNMLKLLRRLIGEDIDLAWKPATGLWPVMMDPVQFDQVLANLCINARDAIAGVGRITIETDNVAIDEDYCWTHADSTPGEYALLTVSDSGCGMDAETVSHLFEPFFTTKEPGKGTGLGLATVYGVVRQNNGFIHVYSEPGQGTTFRIYLPTRRAELPASADDTKPPVVAEHGGMTILLVEDEAAVLRITTNVLQRLGYTVLAASTPGEAIRLAREHTGSIDLVMTDVIMPEMHGRDLANNLQAICPGIRWLYMSGYTADVIAHQGELPQGTNFLQKPFSKAELMVKLDEVLQG